MSRLLDFYLATAAGVYAIRRLGTRSVDHLERTEHPGLVFEDRHRAQDWLYSEAISLLACIRQSTKEGFLRRTVDALWASVDLAESGTNSKTYEGVAAALREAAQEAGDPHAEHGPWSPGLRPPHHRQGLPPRPRGSRAGPRTGRRDGSPDELLGLQHLGVIALYQNQYDDGEAHLTRAIESFRACHDRPGEASAGTSPCIHLAAGRTSSAVSLVQQGTDMYDDMGHALKGANGRYALAWRSPRAAAFPRPPHA